MGEETGKNIIGREVMNVPETADYLHVSESIIRRLIRQKRIPYFQIEGRYLFYRVTLDGWIVSNIVEPSKVTIESTIQKTTAEIWNKSKGL